MKTYYKLFTVNRGVVTPGVKVERFLIEGAGVEIPALLLGERGRGRRLGVVPVEGANPGDIVLAAALGRTRMGRPKLIVTDPSESAEAALLALKCDPGYRGRAEITCTGGAEILAEGYIAEGAAGRMGGGPHALIRLPKGGWVRWHTSGRTYGVPAVWWYTLGEEGVLALSEDEIGLRDDLPIPPEPT